MRFLIYGVLLVILSGCSTKDVSEYSSNTPELNIFEYFQGTTTGWGIVQSRSGELTRQFVVDIKGTNDDEGNLVLDERFVWNDGEKSTRVWTIAKKDTHTYNGTADDVSGVATGREYGNVLNWSYHLNLAVDGSTWKIKFNDWMYLQPDGVLINKAEMSKFGIRVGEITIVFMKNIRSEVMP